MSNEPSTRDIFVGRGTERDEFHTLLRKDCPSYQIYHLYGGGGTGKTRLLEWMVKEVQSLDDVLSGAVEAEAGSELALTARALREQGIQGARVTADLVDFFKTSVHTPLGLLNDIARQLDLRQFRLLNDELEAKGTDPSRHPEEMEEVRSKFLQEFQALAQNNVIVLLFDTFEAGGWMGENLLMEQLSGIGPHTLFVVAGRQRVSFPEKSYVLAKTLDPLTSDNAIDLFRKRDLTKQIIGDQQIKQITELVKGRPIYLALAADWIADAEGTVEELIQANPTEDLGHALVRRILRLQTPEDKAILYLAVIWRSGNPNLLAHLLQISQPEVEKLIERLGRFSFIKYRSPAPPGFAGSCLLHDELRDLVMQHCWTEFDHTGEYQKALTQSALAYYENVMYSQEGPEVAAGRRQARKLEMRNSQVEWLYYQLQLDLVNGVTQANLLFRRAALHREMSFCQQLLDELKRTEFWDSLSDADKADAEFKQGLILYRREKYDDAKWWLSRVMGPNPANPKIRATSLMLLTELCGDRGQIKEGLDYAIQAETAYNALIDAYPQDIILKREKGELYNNWGRLLRIQDDLESAAHYYEQALEIYKTLQAIDISKGHARTLNNLGYVHYMWGDLDLAKIFCRRALQFRERLDFKYELGLSYNTLGIILEAAGSLGEASDMYTKAIAAFDEDQSNYGRGLVLINQGRIHRLIGDFDHALEDLLEARELFQLFDNRNDLAETLNELGCVYRDRRQAGDDKEAEACFRKSIALAMEMSKEGKGGYRVVDNLIDMALMFKKLGAQQATKESLAEVEPLINTPDHVYFRGQALGIRADLLFDEGEKLEKDGRVDLARARFTEAFDAYLDSAAAYVESMQSQKQLYRAEQRYRQALDDIQGKLNRRPSEEVPGYVERLKSKWQEKNFGRFNELVTQCDKLLNAVQYL